MSRAFSFWVQIRQALYDLGWWLSQKSDGYKLGILTEVLDSLQDSETFCRIREPRPSGAKRKQAFRTIEGAAYEIDFVRGTEDGEQTETLFVHPATGVGYRFWINFRGPDIERWKVNGEAMPDPEGELLDALRDIRLFVDRVVCQEEEIARDMRQDEENGMLISPQIPSWTGKIVDPAEEPNKAS
ncbi:hypothetical protein HYV73_04490 [Candidatus Uhrbacteria bacterium]|nr:hypothetical protein [Candidatus Uhrbacteria bacterium]